MKLLLLCVISMMMIFSLPAGPQSGLAGQTGIVEGQFILPQQKFQSRQSYPILVMIMIQDGWHINSHQPLEKNLIPTEVNFGDTPGISFGRVSYMEPVLKKFSFSETPLSVYEGQVFFKSAITISPETADSVFQIRGKVYYQACNDISCLAPETVEFSVSIRSAAENEPTVLTNEDVFRKTDTYFQQDKSDKAGAGGADFAHLIKKSGLLYTLIFIFIGGLALNLTPCVYPLIPITISYFAGQSTGQRSGLIWRAIVYVLGMAITYSVLGLIAALTGGLLGSALQNPLVLIFVALVLVGLALSMFGLYEIRIPQSLAVLGGTNRSGYVGTLLMGLTVGLIAAPCIGPFVLGLLTYVGNLGDPFLGFVMFFTLALGLGAPFLVLGIFSGSIAWLPYSGAWMVWVRNLFGFVLIGMAVYFLQPLFPGKSLYLYCLAILLIVSGIYLGWVDKNRGGKPFTAMRNIVGILSLLLALWLLLPSKVESGSKIKWQPYTSEIISQARQAGKPAIIDFYADWCLPCKELDTYTFADERVVEATEKFVMIKVDLTSFNSQSNNELRTAYDIKGVPIIVFLSTAGKELKELRLAGFEDADKFLRRLDKVTVSP